MSEENLQLLYRDCESFVLSNRTQNIFKDLRNLESLFNFGSLNENHKLFNNKIEKAVGKFIIENSKKNWIDEFVVLGNKAFSFKCFDLNTNSLKGISTFQSKNIEFDEYCNCLFGGEYQKKCDICSFPSVNHELYLQLVKKSTLPPFDDKQCYENNIKSKPWNYHHYMVVKRKRKI